MRMTETEMREKLNRYLSQETDSHQVEEALKRISSGQRCRDDFRIFSQRLVDTAMAVLDRDTMSVESYLTERNEVKDFEERQRLDDSVVVVSRDGLKTLFRFLIWDGIGLTHNLDPIRQIVEATPED